MHDRRREKILARIEKRKGPGRKLTLAEFIEYKRDEREKLKLMTWKEFAEAMGLPESPEVNG